jgi:hypothetical protein
MNLKVMLRECFNNEWSEADIKKLNKNRLKCEKNEFNFSSTELTGAGPAASNLKKILSGAVYTPNSVAFAPGIGLVLIQDDGTHIRTETGRILEIGTTDLVSTERDFVPLYPPELTEVTPKWKEFVKFLCKSSVEDRLSLYDNFVRRDMPYMYFMTYGRPVVVTSSAGSNNYNGQVMFYTENAVMRINITTDPGKATNGNTPPFSHIDAFRDLTDDEIDILAGSEWFQKHMGGRR